MRHHTRQGLEQDSTREGERLLSTLFFNDLSPCLYLPVHFMLCLVCDYDQCITHQLHMQSILCFVFIVHVFVHVNRQWLHVVLLE